MGSGSDDGSSSSAYGSNEELWNWPGGVLESRLREGVSFACWRGLLSSYC